jgi:hypothetical protein
MPELLFSADPKLAKRLCHTGLIVERRLGHYEQLEAGFEDNPRQTYNPLLFLNLLLLLLL